MTKSLGGWLAVGIVAAAAAAALYFGSQFETPKRDASTLLALTLPDPSGHPQALSQWRGKVLVVNFWATWCAPCREEMPEFVKAQSELGSKGLQFVGIAVDQADKAQEF